jgi:hypothetical protein
MSLSFYDASVPALRRGLVVLDNLLAKAEAHVAETGIDPATLLNARIAPDMHPFTRQVQMVSDNAKGAVARLAGIDAPAMADEEQSLGELRQRIARTIAFVDTVKPADISDDAGRTIVLKLARGEITFTAQSYLLGFALPNFYFHLTTAYDLLRQQGLAIGKRDFIGQLG